ncbi:Uncharacterised protein [uncultured archaeon]|nr:Uncharacterised protein [uncultured archaeon]
MAETKKYLITSAQACYEEPVKKKKDEKEDDDENLGMGIAEPNPNFLNGLERYVKENDAKLIILPMAGKSSKEQILHEDLIDRPEIFGGESWVLNKNLQIRDIVVPPQNVDPANGKATLVSDYNSSLIFAHTKQRFCPIPVFNADLPRYIYNPGAVTMPNYNTLNHKGDTAKRKHAFGALLVEVLDNTFYNVTNIRALKNGKFVDRNKLYDGDHSPKKIDADFMVIGDYHLGNHDEKAVKATYEMIETFKPKRIFIHDFFDGFSINHHEKDNFLRRKREFNKGRLSLEDELKMDYEELMRLVSLTGKNTEIYVVSSNHHAFLSRYINEKEWIERDEWNTEIGLYLAYKGTSLKIPENEIDDAAYLLEEGMKKHGPIPERVKFLRLKDNVRRYGYQLASHGDKGKSGARGGGAKAREITGGGKSVTGHSHAMEIYGNTYITGTNSLLDQPYTAGFGNANIAANVIGYPTGTIQVLPIIEGKWMKFGL